MPANQLLLSAEYGPTHSLEFLAKRDLFDLRFTSDCAFLDPGFLTSSSVEHKQQWREFLGKLGVDSELERNSERVAQRIAVKCALRYEAENGRSPKELEESVKRGYDIESDAGIASARFIEAKGSKGQRPDMRLTVNEFRALKRHPETYFVYIVTNAWTNPELSIVGGDELTDDSMEYAVTIPFSQWSALKKGPYTFPDPA
jgi:hypothetical protein